MAAIPPRFMQDLRDRLNLSEIVGRTVKLSRAGREFKACCPFHNEKSPSFYVNDEKQFYHCFGCGAHGDVAGFVMRHNNLSFIEAVESLAAQAGLQVPQQTPQDIARAKTEKSLYSLLDETAQWFEARLRDGAERDALTYLRERGLGDETLGAFRIGYAPADGKALPAFLKTKGYTEAQMVESGIARRSEKHGGVYSFFRDRVMFPVPDRRGRVVAFGGRVLPEHFRPLASGEAKPPKYINSSETALFHKGEMLYGEPHARQAARDNLPLLVVEGYLDVIAAFTVGYRGALAPLGTALTEEQIIALWRMIPADSKVPVLCFDGDDAGRRAAARACERILPLLKPDHSVRFAFLPDGHDPDSLIKAQGPAAFAAILDSALSLVDFLWVNHTMGRTFKTPEERAGLSRALESESLRIPDRDVQHYYRDALRRKTREAFTDFPATRFAGPAARRPGKAGAGREQQSGIALRRPAYSDTRMAVQILLACLMNHPEIFPQVEEELGRLDFPDDRLSTLRQEILFALNAEENEEGLDSPALRAYLTSRGFAPELEMVLAEAVYTHAGFARPGSTLETVRKGWQDTLSRIRAKALRRELKEAGKTLAGDFSEENAQRLIALQRANGPAHGEDV